MDATNPMTPENQQKRADSRRKRKAILAGGVVLGLGAAVTLAAWSDDVFADGLFSTGGVFTLEGSEEPYGTDAFKQARTEGSAIRLTFNTDNAQSAAGIIPGDTLYAPFSIRLTANSTLSGELEKVTASATGPMNAALQYSISYGATTCDEDGNGDPLAGNGDAWVSNQPVNGGEATPTSPRPLVPNDAGTPGTIVPLCVAVTFPDTEAARNSVDSANITTNTSVVWDFFGEQTTTP